jgi:hypothetical protein
VRSERSLATILLILRQIDLGRRSLRHVACLARAQRRLVIIHGRGFCDVVGYNKDRSFSGRKRHAPDASARSMPSSCKRPALPHVYDQYGTLCFTGFEDHAAIPQTHQISFS